MWSGAGILEAYDVHAPHWADLSGGYQYCIVLGNPNDTEADIPEVTIETAEPLGRTTGHHADYCVPDPATWHPLQLVAGCDFVLNHNTGNAEIGPAHLPPHSQCSWSAPCPEVFIRLEGVPTDLTAVVVVTRLKRTGGPAIPELGTPPVTQHP